MRGRADDQLPLFHVFSIEDRIRADHPLRDIKRRADRLLAGMSAAFEKAYSRTGRPSVPPERLLEALLLMALYAVRSERQLCERIDTDLLFRWFLDLQPSDDAFDPTTFAHNRGRLDGHDLTRAFFAAVVGEALAAGPCSEHFTVDGTRIASWASAKSFQPASPAGGGTPDANGFEPRNPDVDSHGRARTNDTHRSRTDPEAKLHRKGLGKEAKLSHMGHALGENRHGLIVAVAVTEASGTAEREAAPAMPDKLKATRGLRPTTLGADKGYDDGQFLLDLESRRIEPHVPLVKEPRDPAGVKHLKRRPGVEARRRMRARQEGEGYRLRQRCRKKIEEDQADCPSSGRGVGSGRTGYRRRDGVARGGRAVPPAPGRTHRRSRAPDPTRRPAPPRGRRRRRHRRATRRRSGRASRPTGRSTSTTSSANSSPGPTRPEVARGPAVTEPLRSPKLRPRHLDRVAVAYVRPSPPQQVLGHRESTARQDALADRAVALGWTRARVVAIGDDPGASGRPVEGRPGFQRRRAEVALDRVGRTLGRETSRPVGPGEDWHHLLGLCGRDRVLLADADRVFDPTGHSGRLSLGPHGATNEAERHVPKERMYQGELDEARRGESFGGPPIGYVRTPTGEWAIDPDEQVQAVVRRVFDQSDREATPHGRLRHLVRHRARVPVRPAGGPSRGRPEWRGPDRATLQNLLCRPSYARAYRYGHRPTDPRRTQPGRPATGKWIRRPGGGPALLRDRLPAYIARGRFEANRERPRANRDSPATPGAPRKGPAGPAGSVRCGRRGRRMAARYPGPNSRRSDVCTRGAGEYGEPIRPGVSHATAPGEPVAGRRRAAVRPAPLEARLGAVAGVERDRGERARQWHLKRERGAYGGRRAARQYRACEPENRLAARDLERRWEDALEAQRRPDGEDGRGQRAAPTRPSDTAASSVRALAAGRPAGRPRPRPRRTVSGSPGRRWTAWSRPRAGRVSGWTRPRTGSAGRPPRASRRARPPARPARGVPPLDGPAGSAVWGRPDRGRDCRAPQRRGGHPPERTARLARDTAPRVIGRPGPGCRPPPGRPAGLGPSEYRPAGLAGRLAIRRDTVRRWVRVRWGHVRRDAGGHHIIWADAAELRRLREFRRLPRTWANNARRAELQEPRPRPARSTRLGPVARRPDHPTATFGGRMAVPSRSASAG